MYDPVGYWRSRGRSYEAQFRRTSAFVEQEAALAGFLAGLDFRSVLDVGCGFARIGLLIHSIRSGVVYTGLDVSPEMLASARAALPGGIFIESSLEAFESSRRFDLVIAAEVAMHQPPEEIAGFVMKMKRLARQHLVTVDWDEPRGDAPRPARGNFLHDYRRLYGVRATRIAIGRQAIWHLPMD